MGGVSVGAPGLSRLGSPAVASAPFPDGETGLRGIIAESTGAFGFDAAQERPRAGAAVEKGECSDVPARKDVNAVTKSEETRVRILHAALQLFREKGYEAATMRDIAVAAGVATGAAYYYFDSKDAIVLAFYQEAAAAMTPLLEEVLTRSADVGKRLAGIFEVKLGYFEPSRRLLAALAVHVDPAHPLSPFSEATAAIREQDIGLFERAISGSKLHVPDDLARCLPRLIWMYQMGIILYWIHDRSAGQAKTRALIDGSLRLVVRLIQLSGLPLMRPLRRRVIGIFEAAAG